MKWLWVPPVLLCLLMRRVKRGKTITDTTG